MPIFKLQNRGSLSTLTCLPLKEKGFINAFSTRKGGVSPLPHQSLNLAYKNDQFPNVDENRKRFFKFLNLDPNTLTTGHQTHSHKAFWVKGPLPKEPEADALYTSQRDVVLGVKTADCLPLLIGDPLTGLFSSIHAGWRGTANKIVQKTIRTLIKNHQVQPQNLYVALGPSACGDCYEVDEDVVSIFQKKWGQTPSFIRKKDSTKFALDVAKANQSQLSELGIPTDQIFQSDHCTMHHNDLYFSHRKEGKGGKTPVGRLLSVIGRV